MTNIGFGKRLAAVLLDFLIVGIPYNIIQALIFGSGAYDAHSPTYPKALTVSLIFGIVYSVGMWAFADGATIGKKIMKIKIVMNDDSPLTLGSAVWRYFSYLIASIPCGLGVLWILWDKENRGLHDKMANTKVISTEPSNM